MSVFYKLLLFKSFINKFIFKSIKLLMGSKVNSKKFLLTKICSNACSPKQSGLRRSVHDLLEMYEHDHLT